MTLKEALKNIYENGFVGGCTAVCTVLWLSNQISDDRYRNQHRALMASVSSQLCKFVKEKILQITPYKTGVRGGKVYERYIPLPEEALDQI